MNKFGKLYNDLVMEHIYPFEDYSNSLRQCKNGYYEYIDCYNNCIIKEDSLSRLFSFMQVNDFAIVTAYRKEFSKIKNIQRNRILRDIFNKKEMGVHQLVGYWQEAPEGKAYKDCNKSELKDVVERSYVVFRNSEEMTFDEFKNLILSVLTIDGKTQDAAVIKNNNGVFLIFPNGQTDLIGKHCTLGVIEQAYSQHVKNSLPFVFNGLEEPASNMASQLYTKHKILF